MAHHIDRRQKLALDEAYKIYRQIIKGEKKPDLYQLAHCLTTLSNVITDDTSHQFKLTKRLWERIYENLCDLLITSYNVYLVIYNTDNEIQLPGMGIVEPAAVEIHTEGLKRKTDIFKVDLDHLNALTRDRIMKNWVRGRSMFSPEDFQNLDCGEFCAAKSFLIGDEVLKNESEIGKERAHKKWWDLYWQAYCTHVPLEKQAVQKEMQMLEEVWGNLYY